MTTPTGVSRLVGLAGGLLSSASRAVTTSTFWNYVKSAAQAHGADLGGITIFDANVVRGQINAVFKARDALTAAQPTDAISAEMIAPFPGTLRAEGAPVVTEYQVRWPVTYIEDQVERTAWFTERYVGGLPSSVGALQQDLGNLSQLLIDTNSQGIQGSLTGVGDAQILAL